MDSVEGELRLVDIQRFLHRIGATRGILFGSRARGDYIASSDVDLIIISDKFADVSFPWRMVFLHENWDLPLYLEGLPYTEDEFTRLKQTSSVVQDAVKHGIEIWPDA
ncbi:MAG TPA: nucleotidyltransferase domain-containing protein [Bacillota bacterium]|nr:nucleotidyltransferase domain-containing protein [Bacillota bacterium]